MIEEVVKAFDGLLTDFTWRRLTAIIFFSVYVTLAFAGYETFTSHFRLNRIQQATDILAKLQEIESKGLSPDSNLSSLHAELVRQLQDSAVPATARIVSLRPLWKSLAAVVPWLLFITAYLFKPLFWRSTYTRPQNPEGVILGLH